MAETRLHLSSWDLAPCWCILLLQLDWSPGSTLHLSQSSHWFLLLTPCESALECSHQGVGSLQSRCACPCWCITGIDTGAQLGQGHLPSTGRKRQAKFKACGCACKLPVPRMHKISVPGQVAAAWQTLWWSIHQPRSRLWSRWPLSAQTGWNGQGTKR